jgi:hypothetical protein
MHFGRLDRDALELRVPTWIDGNGKLSDKPLRLA